VKKKIYAVVTLLLGVASIVAACHTTSDIRAKSGWPSVTGHVLERHLEPGRRAWRREPRVVYEYTVDDKAFKNDQVFMLPHTDGDEAEMRNLVDSEIPDRPEVYYDPDDPKQSYLIASSKLWFYILLPVGIVLILVGVVMLAGGKPDEPVRGT
jgi:hypothetical protein